MAEVVRGRELRDEGNVRPSRQHSALAKEKLYLEDEIRTEHNFGESNLTHRFAHRYTEADPTGGLTISRAWSTEWTVEVGGQSVGGPVVFDCTENCWT